MTPNLNQSIARYKGEGYSLIFSVDLGDPEANAASVTEAEFWMGGVTIAGTAADTATAGTVDVTVVVPAASFSALDTGTYLFEVSLKIGGDPAVVAGGTFALDRSRNLGGVA